MANSSSVVVAPAKRVLLELHASSSGVLRGNVLLLQKVHVPGQHEGHRDAVNGLQGKEFEAVVLACQCRGTSSINNSTITIHIYTTISGFRVELLGGEREQIHC